MENNTPNKKIFSIKVPARVVNNKNLIEALGGEANIISKLKTNENIDFKFLYNTLPLEKCISNDILIKRKVKRNKKDKNKIKYKYFIMGKITNMMQAFALENFIYINEEKTSMDDLGKYLIEKEEYEKEEINNNDEGKVVSNLIKKKYKEINNVSEGENIEKYFKYFQPKNFANIKNSSQNVPKLIKNKFSIEQFKEG